MAPRRPKTRREPHRPGYTRILPGYAIRTMIVRRSILLAAIAALALSAGCSAVSSVMGDVTGSSKKKEEEEKVARVQAELMGFADVYVGEILATTRPIPVRTAEEQLFALNFQVSQASAAYEIASGSTPYASVLDIVVLVSLTRWAVDAYWGPWAVGKDLDPLRASLAMLEPKAWHLAAEILSPQQMQQLKDFIARWEREHTQAREVSSVRFSDVFVAKSEGGLALGTTTELLQSFGLDPFGGLDPAVQEVQQTRVLAERAFYFAKRWPRLLELQTRQLALELARQPTPAQVTADLTRFSLAAESVARTAEGLPGLVDREREASIRQILDAMVAQEARATAMLADVRRTLDAGAGAAKALHGALGTFDQIVRELTAPSPPGSPPGHPFDVNEYTRALDQLQRTSAELERLLASVDRDAPQVARLIGDAGREASARGRALVDYAFGRLLVLGLALIGAALAAAVLYRWVASRIARAGRPG